MVSNASDDLPDPDRPVITTSASRGSSRLMSLRLCSRAPETTIRSCLATAVIVGGSTVSLDPPRRTRSMADLGHAAWPNPAGGGRNDSPDNGRKGLDRGQAGEL